MADKQPPTVVEGATTGDVEDQVVPVAKSAEDRKAASALASLEGEGEGDTSSAAQSKPLVDQEAVTKAIKTLSVGGAGGAAGGSAGGRGGSNKATTSTTSTTTTTGQKKDAAAIAKNIKVDQADVALLVNELDLTKPKATELLKTHQGDAVKALRAYIQV